MVEFNKDFTVIESNFLQQPQTNKKKKTLFEKGKDSALGDERMAFYFPL